MNSSDSHKFKIPSTDVRREVAEMLEGFEHQATFSLKRIDRRFESTGQSLDEEFRKYFLQVSIERLSTSYANVQFESRISRIQTGGFINETSTQTGNGLQAENSVESGVGLAIDCDKNVNHSSIPVLGSQYKGSLVKVERTNSVDDDENVKLEKEATQMDSVVEILSSSDEEDIDESQNNRLQTVKNELNETDLRFNASGNEVSHNNYERNTDEVSIKEEFNIEPKQEMIDEDIPIRIFDPRDVSSNGGYKSINDATNKNGAGSSLQLTERNKEKPSCPKDSKQFNCELCEYGTDYKGNLNRHFRTHTNEKPFRCSRCPKRFTQSSHLTAHMATHKDEFPFHCSNCFRGFIQINEKVAHEKNCRDHSYECYVCKYVTNLKTHLVRHMRTHTGNKPYRCSRCSKGFTQLYDLKRHMATHKAKKLPFHCKGCLHRFAMESEKRAHEKDCRYRRYECDICKKYVTGNKTQMKNHMRVHTGEQPFRCEVCMKSFSFKCALKTHLNTVHNKLKLCEHKP